MAKRTSSHLTELQKGLIDLLRILKVEEDTLVGTILALKDSVMEQEEMFLYLYHNRPSEGEIIDKVEEIVLRRQ